MNKTIVAILVSLLAGFTLASWVMDDPPEPAPLESAINYPESAATAEDRLLFLERLIAEERDARFVLEEQLAVLAGELEGLAPLRELAGKMEQQEREIDETLRARSNGSGGRRGSTMAERMRQFMDHRRNSFRDAGFTENEIDRVFRLEGEMQLQAMNERWEAEKNGETISPWSGNPTKGLREAMGDLEYERYLRAQGQPSSVDVSMLLEGSPAANAGLQAGDKIISYNGVRTFTVFDVREQTFSGERGENVIVEIERDGTVMQLSVPRGPLGINGSNRGFRGGFSWFGG